MKNALALVAHPSAVSIDSALLESQYKSRARSGEARLMLALLKDGIECFYGSLAATDAQGKELFAETERWIFERDSDWVFSFENVCEALGIDPSYLRTKLRQRKQTELVKERGRRARLRLLGSHHAPSQPTGFAGAGKMVAVAGG